jgi:hypothetical protein
MAPPNPSKIAPPPNASFAPDPSLIKAANPTPSASQSVILPQRGALSTPLHVQPNPATFAPDPSTFQQPQSQSTAMQPSKQYNAPLPSDPSSTIAQMLDDSNKDKHGFSQDEMSLHDAFTLKPVKFREQLPEMTFQQVVIQNSRVWLYTQRSNYLIKAEVDANGAAKSHKVLDNQMLR